MLYNYESEFDRERILHRVKKDLEKKTGLFEYTNHSKRSLKQNNYMHLCCGLFAMENGLSLEYVKLHYFKIHCNPDIFVSKHNDMLVGEVTEVRSSKDITKEEMTLAMERFSKWGADEGVLLPDPTDGKALQKIESDINKMRKYGL